MNNSSSRSKKPTISVIIVTYNSERTISDCVLSLKKLKEFCHIETVIIDNKSSDGTREVLYRLRDQGLIDRLLLRPKNYGFAKSVNFGVKKATGEHIALVNPDIAITSTKRLKSFVDYVINHDDEIVGPTMSSRTGTLERSFVSFPSALTYIFDYTNIRKIFPNNRWHRKFYYLDLVPTATTVVDAISGAFCVFSTKTYKMLGGLDERFFMYLEDVDFCYQANQKLGVKCVLFAGTDILHIAGESSANRDRVNHQAWIDSRQKYLEKNEKNILVKVLVSILFKVDAFFISSRIKKYESSRR